MHNNNFFYFKDEAPLWLLIARNQMSSGSSGFARILQRHSFSHFNKHSHVCYLLQKGKVAVFGQTTSEQSVASSLRFRIKNKFPKQTQRWRSLNTHPDRCHTGRRTCSTRSGRGATPVRLWWTAGAAGWTDSRPQWESWAWWGRCAGRCRKTSTCAPSACRTGQRWRRHHGSTGSKLREEATAKYTISTGDGVCGQIQWIQQPRQEIFTVQRWCGQGRADS